VTLDVYDLSGRLVSREYTGNLPAGGSILGFTGPAGLYTAVLSRSDCPETERFVLVR
jgi:hypothetical protein